jgi:hypothetical protein
VHVNYHRAILQVQVHVSADEGFGTVQAKALHDKTHHSTSFSARLLQHCLQIGSFSPLKRMYSLMFSLLHLCFQGFLQCSNTFNLHYRSGPTVLAETEFKARGETGLCNCGEMS